MMKTKKDQNIIDVGKEQLKITEVEGLPKDDDEYYHRLMKKDIFIMNLEELKDYLDYVIQGRIDIELNPALIDLFSHIQYYFRVVDLQTNLIIARANSAHSLAYALALFLKDKFPDSYEDIITVMEEVNKEKDMKALEGLPIKSQEDVMKKAKLLYRQNEGPKVD